MPSTKKTSTLVVVIFMLFLLGIDVFYIYAVSAQTDKMIEDDRQYLGNFSAEIVAELSSTGPLEWKTVVSDYNDVHVEIRDESNKIILNTIDKSDDVCGVKIHSVFECKGQHYILTVTAFLFRNVQHSVVRYLIGGVIIFITWMVLLFLFMYSLTLQPYRKVYRGIAEYDETGVFRSAKIKGYAGKVYDRFRRMAERSSKAQDNQQQIIASISHDIKTPLTSIMGYSERLKSAELSEERKEQYIDIIYTKSKEISSILDSFDEYLGFKLQEQLDLEEISIEELRAALIREYADELEQNGVKFNVVCRNKRALVRLDMLKMNRVFGNLISNSIKHMNDPKKLIEVEMSCVDETVYIIFSDNGEGVPEDKLETIFTPLYTSDKGRKVAGLGLSISREIVTKHGGLIYARPSEYGGLSVIIELKQGI